LGHHFSAIFSLEKEKNDMLEIKNLAVAYDNKKVLQEINFSVETGQRLAIIGPNGSGKTTLLKGILGLIEHQGQIKFNNRSLSSFKRIERAEKVALLSQNPTLYFSYTVYETLMLGLYTQLRKRFMAVAGREDKERVLQVMKELNLYEIRKRQLSTLSGGQLQRVFFARTLLQNPDIILLDEPNNHLDIYYQLEMLRYLDKYLDQEKTVIAVFHDINLALAFSENILVLKEGKVLSHGKAEELLTRDFLIQLYQTDVLDYMLKKHTFWQKIEEKKKS
jgi:iron complex transport system ATP-binding protein